MCVCFFLVFRCASSYSGPTKKWGGGDLTIFPYIADGGSFEFFMLVALFARVAGRREEISLARENEDGQTRVHASTLYLGLGYCNCSKQITAIITL